MSLEEKKDVTVVEPQQQQLNEQQDNSKTTVPATIEQDGSSKTNSNDEQKEEKEESNEDEEQERTAEGKGDEGDSTTPSQNGTQFHQTQKNQERNTAPTNYRLEAEKAARKVSFRPSGMSLTGVWGNKAQRANTGSNEQGWIRVGDKGFWVTNPSKNFMEVPFGCPVYANLLTSRRGKGGISLPSNAVTVFDKKKMDLMHIEAIKTAAGVYENAEADFAFEKNFSHHYYTSDAPNLMRGRIFFDTDTKKIAVLSMERSHTGKWLKGNVVPIDMEVAMCHSSLKIGTEILFSTALWGNSVKAHKIFPCALLSSAETETNTRATLPVYVTPEGERESVSVLRSSTTKTIGPHNLKLLYLELSKDKKNRIGEEKWGKLDEHTTQPVDVLVTDNDSATHPDGLMIIGLTPLLLHYQEVEGQSSTPFCWDFLEQFCSEEQLTELDKKVLTTGIGLTIVVETNESFQKTALEWAKDSVAAAVAARRIDSSKAFVDSIGVTCSFGPYVTASNFNETVSDSFFDVEQSIGLQSIKIFDQRIPTTVSFDTTEGVYRVETDLATRGLVVFALEEVSKKVAETEKLTCVVTEDERPASKFFNKNKIVQIKFRTTPENSLFLDKLKREFHLNFFYDHNPASRFVGRKTSRGFRTVKFSTVCWQEEQYLGFLNEIHAQQNTDFFVMRVEDMIGGNNKEWTRFTLGTEDFRTSKVLAALKLRLPLTQMMGINGFLTRIAVKGNVTIESIEAAVQAISKTIPNAIKMVVFNNTIKKYNQREERTWSRPQNFQPHYSQYVVALAGFHCVLDEAEVIGFLELAGVDVSGAKFTWFASDDDFVLQITTSKTDQIQQLREREGGQHDVTTFLKWTPDLSQNLRYVATLGQALVIDRDTTTKLPPGKSILSNREISAIVQDCDQSTNAERAHPAPADQKEAEWTQVPAGRKKKVAFAKPPSTSSSSSSPPPSRSSPGPSSASVLSPSFSPTPPISPSPPPRPSSSSAGANNFAALSQDQGEEGDTTFMEDVAVAEEEGVEDSDSQVRTGKQSAPVLGTVANFSSINANIVANIMGSDTPLTKETCNLLLENKRQDYYGLGYNAEQVYEEMMRLLGMEVPDIIREITPEEDGPTGSKKRARREEYHVPTGDKDDDVYSDSETEENVEKSAITPSHKQQRQGAGGTVGQLILSNMWDQQTTSQTSNDQQNGKGSS